MITMSTGTVASAVRSLSDLIELMRIESRRADDSAVPITRRKLDNGARQLDAIRTKLTERDDCIDEAWAYVDAGRVFLALQIINLDRTIRERRPWR